MDEGTGRAPPGAGGDGSAPLPAGASPGWRFTRCALAIYALMAAAGFFVMARRGSLKAELGRGAPAVAADAMVGLAAAGAILLATAAAARPGGVLERLAARVREVIGPLGAAQTTLLAAASGIGEEALFRGALQPWLGYVATSLLFGVLHFGPGRDFLAWTAFAVVVGFVLGALALWRGSIVAPVAAHVAVNAVNLASIARGRTLRSWTRLRTRPTMPP